MDNSNYKIYDLEDWLPLITPNQDEENEIDTNQSMDSMLTEDNIFKLEHKISMMEHKLALMKKDLQLVNKLKKRYDYKCQICGYSFLMDNGEYYCEAHYIEPVTENTEQTPENVLILCANHHRMFHCAAKNITIGAIIRGKREINIGENTYTVKYKLK
jgi:predicted restriction endonuclease